MTRTILAIQADLSVNKEKHAVPSGDATLN